MFHFKPKIIVGCALLTLLLSHLINASEDALEIEDQATEDSVFSSVDESKKEEIFDLLNRTLQTLDSVNHYISDNLNNPFNTENINVFLRSEVEHIYNAIQNAGFSEDSPWFLGQGTAEILMSLIDIVSEAQNYNQILQSIIEKRDAILSFMEGQDCLNSIYLQQIEDCLHQFSQNQENANSTPSLQESRDSLRQGFNGLPFICQVAGKFLLQQTTKAQNSDDFLKIVENFSENILSLQRLYLQNVDLSDCLAQDISELKEKYPDLEKELSDLQLLFDLLLKCKNQDYIVVVCNSIIQEIKMRFANSKFREALLCFVRGITYQVQDCESSEEICEYWQDVFDNNEFQQFLSTCLFLFDRKNISNEEYQTLITQHPHEYTAVLKVLYDSFQEILNDFLPENYDKESILYFDFARLFFIKSKEYCEYYKNIDKKILKQMGKHEFVKLSYFNKMKLQDMFTAITHNLITLSIQLEISDLPKSVQDVWMQFMAFQDSYRQCVQELSEKVKFQQSIITHLHQRKIFNSDDELNARKQQLTCWEELSSLTIEQGKKLQQVSEAISQSQRQGHDDFGLQEISEYTVPAQGRCANKRMDIEKKIQQLQLIVQILEKNLNASSKLAGTKTSEKS